ncbi:MAG TPA: hypothetical protein VG935_03955, partial [Patescibacteria group bacterium]|nr:hypothetical protein [Patescibacteria group bacterium]
LSLVSLLFLAVPLTAGAQATPTANQLVLILGGGENIVGMDNYINLTKVANACQPTCEIGREVVYYVDPYNQVDQSAAMIVTFDRTIGLTIPEGMSASAFKADGTNVIVPLNSTDRQLQGHDWVAAVLFNGDLPVNQPVRIFNIVDGRCSGYNCLLPQFDGLTIYSPLAAAHCGSAKIPGGTVIVYQKQDEPKTWAVRGGPYDLPVLCERLWVFTPTRSTTTA